MLLVSECEADHILELLWSARGDSTACSFSFVNLAFACESLDRGDGSTKFHETHLALGSSLDQDLPLLSHEAIATSGQGRSCTSSAAAWTWKTASKNYNVAP
ncbi:hypothetical protein JG687_00001493 [Phytophthora cactorum]|uniref:Uncharacterized protein n=1 Tax=Phytophthora cactorum TaxID=29920 RepID=A0A8T1V0V6_9STRA|nr:hypothetical protein JG687_00001493 [Phytophthora cactorum]